MFNVLKSGLALLALAASCSAIAQTYPARPIRVLVTQPAGAASDLLVRLAGTRERVGNDAMEQPCVPTL